jgi:fused signal recognition particle receptor
MNSCSDLLLRAVWEAGAATAGAATAGADDGGIVGAVVAGAVALLFVWLFIAVVRKKLLSSKGRLGNISEDQEEAAESARLWAEARRRTADRDSEEEVGTEEEGDEESGQPEVDLQTELLERARKRREDEPAGTLRSPQRPALNLVPPLETQPFAKAKTSPLEPVRVVAPKAVAPEPQPQQQSVPERESEHPAIDRTPVRATPATPRSLEDGLQKTRREGFVSSLSRLFSRGALDKTVVDEIEEILFTADIGPRTSQRLIDFLQNELDQKERSDTAMLFTALQGKIRSMLEVKAPPLDLERAKPLVILVVGVNGTGKTTTIGKLAQRYTQQGKKVILAAGDTFRAAASEQLDIWGDRAKAQVIRGQDGADPGAVIFDAISAARSQGADMVIADTAGRLHTKVNLVEELRKVQRVCGKALPGAPHEVFLVLDATTGQNAINQAKQFHEALNLTGIVLTKLDGTAKGGVIIGICDTFGIPVRFIGIGEQVEDLRPFEPEAFVKAMFT